MLPNCPKCNSEYTYEDGSLLICPECGHEWTAASQAAEEEANIIKDAVIYIVIGNFLQK